jgi:coenzyme F420-0:L-glutamate ligase/coenzyme F420-1:gamma-L-glutamate ligase
MIEVYPLTGIGEIAPGDDLAATLAEAILRAGIAPSEADILVVTQKIISKAEGRFVDLATVTPGPRARELAEVTLKDPRLVELVLAESSHVLRAVPNVLITRHRSGHVMANAGIDRSNLGAGRGEHALLLPLDADLSARRLRDALALRWSSPPAVVVSDSFGRPWRIGVVNVALGASGMPAIVDRRGEHDRDGRLLEVTQIGLADMVATAAGLATGEAAEGVPAALVRGVVWSAPDAPAAALLRPIEEDLFR